MTDLTLYKASAGSGKTFTLAREYLKLMYRNQGGFSQILAVTFTRKATAEMAERILQELYVLATNQPSGHLEALQEAEGLQEKEVRERARQYLNRLLHNYHRFNISTIDRFFQQILKSFAREVGLNAGFNIEINQGQVVEEAVARLFDRLHEKPKLKAWLAAFAKDKLDEGKHWDVQQYLTNFAKKALNDAFYGLNKEALQALGDVEQFAAYKKTLQKITHDFVQKLQSLGKQAVQIIEKHQLELGDFQYAKSGVVGYLYKICTCTPSDIVENYHPGTRVKKAAVSEDQMQDWVKKKSPQESRVQACVQDGLQGIVQEVLSLFDEELADFYTARSILKELDAFAILVEIFNEVIAYSEEQNIFLLSMASPLLSQMIHEDDAPFVYEKTGQFLQNFMIDEFQDTSQVQWHNFRPLVVNAIATGHHSLVVGDVKQSIYRFRNSDWRLLASTLKKEFEAYSVKEENLPNNWRSYGNVIKFNNWLFREGSQAVSTKLQQMVEGTGMPEEEMQTVAHIYEGAEQKIPFADKNDLGHLKVRFYEKKKEEELSEGEGVFDQTLLPMLEELEQLHAQGYQPGDIAILVRFNREGSLIADFLMEQMNRYPEKKDRLRFVSSDSVFLNSSELIQLIVATLQWLSAPEEMLFRAQLLYLCRRWMGHDEMSLETLATVDCADNNQFMQELPVSMREAQQEWEQMPFLQCVYAIVAVLQELNKEGYQKNQVFVDTFLDQVLILANASQANFTAFLQWWNESGAAFPVQISDDQNAIRIMTIHKSKGLEFDAVLMPFASWALPPKAGTLWFKPQLEPYNTMQWVPVSGSKELKYSHFQQEYYQEQLLGHVDNLNLLYVATTRAKKVLYIHALQAPKKNELTHVGALLHYLVQNVNMQHTLWKEAEGTWDEEHACLEIGTLEAQSEQKAVAGSYALLPGEKIRHDNPLEIRLHSLEFYGSPDEEGGRVRGNLYHRILEQIQYMEDIPKVVTQYTFEGHLTEDEALSLHTFIHQAIEKVDKQAWFSREVRVYNEQSILLADGSFRRPDRVMETAEGWIVVDYKFTKDEKESHRKQVQEYVDVIRALENKETHGFVWYVLQNKLVPV